MRARQRVYLFVVFRLYAQFETSYPAARRYPPQPPAADRGGSTSVRGQIRSPHSSGGLQGSCAAYCLWRIWPRRCVLRPAGTDRRIALSLNAPLRRGGGITVTTLWTLYKYIQLYFTIVYGSTT